jgi:hypothetical protein
VAGVISRDALEVIDWVNLNAAGVKVGDHHLSAGEAALYLKELVSARTGDNTIQISGEHGDRALEVLLVQVSHAAQIYLPDINLKQDFEHVPLPEKQSPVGFAAECHEIMLLVLG